MKLPRTLRMDVSDKQVFHAAAEPGEWAVTGTFAFVDMTPDNMDNKTQLAFRNGWLGAASFGWSTFVQVTVAPDSDYQNAVRSLAGHLFEKFGAPDMLAATEAAKGEFEHAASLSDHPAGTLLAIERELTDDGIAERIRVVPRPDEDGGHAAIWTLQEEPDED